MSYHSRDYDAYWHSIELERLERERQLDQWRIEHEARLAAERKDTEIRVQLERETVERSRIEYEANLELERLEREKRILEWQSQVEAEKKEAERRRLEYEARVSAERAELEKRVELERIERQKRLEEITKEREARISIERAEAEKRRIEYEARVAAERAELEKRVELERIERQKRLEELQKERDARLAIEKAEAEKRRLEYEARVAAEQKAIEERLALEKAEAEKRRLEYEARVAAERKAIEERLVIERAEAEKRRLEYEAKLKLEAEERERRIAEYRAEQEKKRIELEAKLEAERKEREEKLAKLKAEEEARLKAIKEEIEKKEAERKAWLKLQTQLASKIVTEFRSSALNYILLIDQQKILSYHCGFDSRGLFDAIDENKNGVLTVDELKKWGDANGVAGLNWANIVDLWNEKDKSDKLFFSEFHLGVTGGFELTPKTVRTEIEIVDEWDTTYETTYYYGDGTHYTTHSPSRLRRVAYPKAAPVQDDEQKKAEKDLWMAQVRTVLTQAAKVADYLAGVRNLDQPTGNKILNAEEAKKLWAELDKADGRVTDSVTVNDFNDWLERSINFSVLGSEMDFLSAFLGLRGRDNRLPKSVFMKAMGSLVAKDYEDKK